MHCIDERQRSDAVRRYSNAVARGGPESPEALSLRHEFSSDTDFIKMAKVIDRIKRAVSDSAKEDDEEPVGCVSAGCSL